MVQINLVSFNELPISTQLDYINFVAFGDRMPFSMPSISVRVDDVLDVRETQQVLNPFFDNRTAFPISIHAIPIESHLSETFSRAYLAYLIAADASFETSLKQFFDFEGPLTRDLFAQQGSKFFEKTIFPMFAIGARTFIDTSGRKWKEAGTGDKYRKLVKYVDRIAPEFPTPSFGPTEQPVF